MTIPAFVSISISEGDIFLTYCTKAGAKVYPGNTSFQSSKYP